MRSTRRALLRNTGPDRTVGLCYACRQPWRVGMLRCPFAVVVALGCATLAYGATSSPTFSREVAPILYNRCVECHRQGEAAPMAFTSYAEIRPWAKAIKQAVLSRKMPPWLADPHFGAFRNDRRLSDDEIATISTWVDAGAPEGDAKQTPKLPAFESGWRIGKPDAVFDIGTD